MKNLLATTALALALTAAPAFAQETNSANTDNGSSAAQDQSIAATANDSFNDNTNNQQDNSTNVADSGNGNNLGTQIADSLNGNNVNSNNSNDDNSTDNSGQTNTTVGDVAIDASQSGNLSLGQAATQNLFGDNSQVSTSTLASLVTGVTVNFGAPDPNGSVDNSINVADSYSQIAGITAINQNSGVGASQNAAITLSVSTGDVQF